MNGQLQLRSRDKTADATSPPIDCVGARVVRTAEEQGRPDAGVSAALGDLRPGPQAIYECVATKGATAREIANAAGFIVSATRAHLQTLEAAGLAVKIGGGWVRC